MATDDDDDDDNDNDDGCNRDTMTLEQFKSSSFNKGLHPTSLSHELKLRGV